MLRFNFAKNLMIRHFMCPNVATIDLKYKILFFILNDVFKQTKAFLWIADRSLQRKKLGQIIGTYNAQSCLHWIKGQNYIWHWK